MLNAKVKVPNNKKSGGGLPIGNSQGIKVATSATQGVNLMAGSMSGGGGQQASGGNIHGSHAAKKLSDGQHGSRNHLNQSKFSNSAANASGNINLHLYKGNK